MKLNREKREESYHDKEKRRRPEEMKMSILERDGLQYQTLSRMRVIILQALARPNKNCLNQSASST